MTFTFDYHANPSGFLGWAIINMMSSARVNGQEDFFDELSRLSNKFTNVEMRITLNGLEADVPAFLASLDRQMDHAAERAVKEKLDGIHEINDVSDELAAIQEILRQRKFQLAKQYDIRLDEDD